MRKEVKRIVKFTSKCLSLALCVALVGSCLPSSSLMVQAAEDEDVVVLRVCNWEEYIDLGDWDEEEEIIDLETGDILGVNPMYEDFEEWYYETYGQKVRVEYSCFGTNEELYNMLTLGDVYDLVCPSEYMIMKMMSEDMVVPLSEDFFDTSDENNYYINGVSPFIKESFETNEINGEPWSKYAAGFMWGVTGNLYNPEVVTYEEAATWSLLTNEKFKRQITIKDNVRDSFFAAAGAVKKDLLTSKEFISDPNYHDNLAAEMNDVSDENIADVLAFLQDTRENAYSFETDSGKADMITGKVVAGYQWSGDAVYAMDQAEEDDFIINFAVPVESTNLYFDGWVMLKKGIEQDPGKQHAAEAFINYVSRPDNVVRNMYYIGYTSVISGANLEADENPVFQYAKWCYETEEEEGVEYPLGYFFSGDNADEDYSIVVDAEQTERQMAAQYPSLEVMERSAIMRYFDPEETEKINQMWIDVRCYNIKRVPVWAWCIVAVIVVGLGVVLIRSRRQLVE